MKRLWNGFCWAACVPMLFAQPSVRPFAVEDLVQLDRISEPAISPDGDSIVFVMRSYDLESDTVRRNLWITDRKGSQVRQLTTDPASDFSPRWAPSGEEIYFLSNRSGSEQVWKISLLGGEAGQVTDLPLAVSNLLVSPKGPTLIFSADVFPDCPDIPCTVERLGAGREGRPSGMVYDELFVRHWDTWRDGTRRHLFSMKAEGGEPIDLMKGLEADSPSQPFGGVEELAVTPDGTGLVFTSKMVGREAAWSTNFDLWFVPLDGSSAPRCLTHENKAWDTRPAFSPDGRTLAYLAMERPGFEADRFRIRLVSWPTGSPRVLAESWDRSVDSMIWSSDSRVLYVTAAHLGQTALFRVDVEAEEVSTLVGKGTVSSPMEAGNSLFFAYDTLQSPAELHSLALGGEPSPLTRVNADRLAAVRMGEAEQFTFRGWNDETVYGYAVKPAEFSSDRKYPVAFLVHGGPQGSFGNHFHYRWNPQTYSGAGYAVLMIDFHGSVGYGQSFTDSISGDWGGKPLEDLRRGLQAALQRYPWMDGERVGALGASYGGYMINWIAGNWPDRFRCLVSHDGTFDMRSMYYSTEELWFPEWEQGGPYWINPAGHEEHNPATLVERWKTPMLVIHGALDYRVPLEQGIATFTVLQRRGIPSRFLYFPDENHWVLKPRNSIQWHHEVAGWLDRWLK